MKFRTEGLIIKEQNIGEQDKLVHVLTKPHGVVKAFVRGAKNIKNGNTIKTADVISITLLCIRYFLIFLPLHFTSSHVRKPIPPTIINPIMVTLANPSPAYSVKEENCALSPIKSKPALQNAEIE